MNECGPMILSSQIWRRITRQAKDAFISAFVFGCLVHIVLMIRQSVCADPILFMDWYKSEDWFLYNQGRWATNIFTNIRAYLIDPALCTLLTILSVSFVAAIAVSLFDIKSRLCAVLAGAAVVVHPYIANSLMYYSTGGTLLYAIAVFPAWLIYKTKLPVTLKCVLAVAVYTIVLGASQGAICILTLLPVLMLALNLLNGENKKTMWTNFVIEVISCLAGCVLYLVIWNHYIDIYEIDMLYGGASSYSLSNTLANLPRIIKGIYHDFINYFLGDNIIHNTHWGRGNVYRILAAFIGLNGIGLLISKFRKHEMSLGNIALFLLVVAVIPMAAMSINFIVTEYSFYLMMANAFILFIPVFCKLIEMACGHEIWGTLYEWGSIICCVLIIWTYALSDIAGYLVLDQTFTQSKELAARVLDRIEDTEGFDYDMFVCFIGNPDDKCYTLNEELVKACPGSTFTQGAVFTDGLANSSHGWGRYIDQYCGVHLKYLSYGTDQWITDLANTEQFKNMGCYPAVDSVAIIKDVMVVKFGEIPN